MNRSFPKDLSNNYEAEDKHNKKYFCAVCGYQYHSTKIPFELLPDTWVCPICHTEKTIFRLL